MEHNQASITRRHAMTRGLALGAGLALGMSRHATSGQSTPTASPVAGTYARPETLIDAATLLGRENDRPSTIIALMAADEFVAASIPGAVQVDWPQLEITDTSDASVARWQTAMTALSGALGVSRDRPVVAYDGGSLFAARIWWLLHHLGYNDVSVLNGGLPAWNAAGGAVAADVSPPPPATPTPTSQPQPRPDAIATLAEVQAALDDPDVAFVDARTPEEYAAGHIPGAVNVNYPRNAAPNPPHVWLPQEDLLAMYASVGATPDKRVIPYCTTGVRSSVTYFTLSLIDYDNISLFTGSWAEWSRHPELPVTTGDAP